MKRLGIVLLAALSLCSEPLLAAGAVSSWHASAASLRVAVAGRDTPSALLTPPAMARGRSLEQVRWQFQLPMAAHLQAWLCHPQRCVELDSRSGVGRGLTRGLAGLDAGQPLHFRFHLAPGMPAVEVRGLQLFVHYR